VNLVKSAKEVAADIGCVTGRFQPPHEGHLELIRVALSRHQTVIAGITNPDAGARAEDEHNPGRHLPQANPFTYYERLLLLRAVMDAEAVAPGRVEIVPFPLHSGALCLQYAPASALQYVRAYSEWERHKANMLRSYGYPVEVIEPATPKQRAGGDIRSAMATGGQWRDMVPASTVELLDVFLAQKPIEERMTP
jgi:nicotinamide-nucleotide adenylyltransferase